MGQTLFWRTFPPLAALVMAVVALWLVLLNRLELEPQALQQARQLATLVNLSRTALGQVDGINRVDMLKTLGQGADVRVRLREPTDRAEPFETDAFSRQLARELRAQLGSDARVARRVNDVEGLWVEFSIGADRFWVQTSVPTPGPLPPSAMWLAAMLLALTAVSLAWIARFVTRPLRELAEATGRIREGQLESRLDEQQAAREIREVNIGFNLMSQQIERAERDRQVMLSGISHDLRTPLTRLMMDVQMNVPDEASREAMMGDIAQLNAIIGKFMEYARESEVHLARVALQPLVAREAQAAQHVPGLKVQEDVPAEHWVMADEIELGRVFQNLLENARRYACTPGADAAEVHIVSRLELPWVVIAVRDHGPGVAPDQIGRLTTPFYRGDEARSDARGAGLGLAIVDKVVRRMGGELSVANEASGGLRFEVKLKAATG
jgi:two-component system osmolarity sensor histidine kinase EnvZ